MFGTGATVLEFGSIVQYSCDSLYRLSLFDKDERIETKRESVVD